MPFQLTFSAAALIIANAVPILGVMFWGWDAAAILVLYWLESVVIGLLNVIKLLTAGGFNKVSRNLFLAVFFTVHYGLFTFGHGTFLAQTFEAKPIIDGLKEGGPLLWTAISFVISHLVSMVVNYYGKGEYLRAKANDIMMLPYSRVFVMHIVIIFGGFLVMKIGEPLPAVILLIVLKTAIDWKAHLKEHRRAALEINEAPL